MRSSNLFACLIILVAATVFVSRFSLAEPFDRPANHLSEELLQAISRIDGLVEANLEANGLKRNPPISDDIFARRIYLDIAGRIPTFSELSEFLESENEDKRARLIDELLET